MSHDESGTVHVEETTRVRCSVFDTRVLVYICDDMSLASAHASVSW